MQREVKNYIQLKYLLEDIFKEDEWIPCEFNLIIFNNDTSLELRPGDIVSANSHLKSINGPANPAQFNYRRFLSRKNIYLSSRVSEVVRIGRNRSIDRLAFLLRKQVIGFYKAWGINGTELSILIALTLGDKSQLSGETREAFAGAGAMHILAVSGLHVGIIFLMFNYLLGLLPSGQIYKWLKMLLLLVIVWSFAFLSGFSSSVQRAAWMFSFIIISKTYNRNSHVINSIAASAFLAILVDSKVLFQLGFQLSYSAVIGIVLIHPSLSKFVNSRYTVVNKIWSLLVVSFAAQLATLPLTLYYFHQFPNYFFLTNLIVIPLSFAIVGLTIVLIPFYYLFSNTFYLGYLDDFLLKGLNYFIEKIYQLPYSTTKDVWIEDWSLLFLIITILLFTLSFYVQKRRVLVFSLICLFSFIAIECGICISSLEFYKSYFLSN